MRPKMLSDESGPLYAVCPILISYRNARTIFPLRCRIDEKADRKRIAAAAKIIENFMMQAL